MNEQTNSFELGSKLGESEWVSEWVEGSMAGKNVINNWIKSISRIIIITIVVCLLHLLSSPKSLINMWFNRMISSSAFPPNLVDRTPCTILFSSAVQWVLLVVRWIGCGKWRWRQSEIQNCCKIIDNNEDNMKFLCKYPDYMRYTNTKCICKN